MTTIFLADDHIIVRSGVRLLLEQHKSYTVIGEASDGHTAVREILRLHPAIAVLDAMMPLLNGIEATRRLRASGTAALRIVILSVCSSLDTMCRAFDAGADAYVLKASPHQELLKALAAVSNHQKYVDQTISLDIRYRILNARHHHKAPVDALSGREREVLQLVAEGHSSAQIAAHTGLSPKSVDTYRSRVMEKLGVANAAQLIKLVVSCNMMPHDD